jgi:hypothetical protein
MAVVTSTGFLMSLSCSWLLVPADDAQDVGHDERHQKACMALFN